VPGWLGWTPASRCSVQRSAYLSCSCRCNTSQQAGDPWPVVVRCALYADGAVDMAMAICLYAQPASNVHTYIRTSRPPPQTHRQRCSVRLAHTHDLLVVRLGELCCLPARRWVAGREGGAVWRHMVVRFSTLTSYLAWNLRQCNTPLHISQPDGRSHHHLDRASSVRSRREGMCAGDVLLNEGPRDHMLFPFPHNRSKYLQEDCPPP